jgi:hypothetical protein
MTSVVGSAWLAAACVAHGTAWEVATPYSTDAICMMSDLIMNLGDVKHRVYPPGKPAQPDIYERPEHT